MAWILPSSSTYSIRLVSTLRFSRVQSGFVFSPVAAAKLDAIQPSTAFALPCLSIPRISSKVWCFSVSQESVSERSWSPSCRTRLVYTSNHLNGKTHGACNVPGVDGLLGRSRLSHSLGRGRLVLDRGFGRRGHRDVSILSLWESLAVEEAGPMSRDRDEGPAGQWDRR